MKKNKIFAMMAAAMTFAACSTSDITDDARNNNNDDDNTVTVASVTRAGENQTTTPSTTVDMYESFLLTNLTQKEKAGYNYEAIFEYNNNVWEPSEKVMWYGSGENVFQATYPCANKNGYQLQNIEFDKFMIPGYQYNNSDSIPDWMRATETVARNNGALNLEFKHMLSKVTVVIDYNNITLDGNTVTSASVSKIFTRVQYCEAVTDADGKVTINPYQKTEYDTDGLYVWTTPQSPQSDDTNNKKASTTAIVAPGAYTNIAKVSVSYEGRSEEIVLYLPAGSTLEAGKHYTFTLSSATITHKEATISSVSVEPWNDGTISSSKPAEFIPYVTFTSNKEVKFKMTAEKGEESDFTISGLEYSVNNSEWKSISENGISEGVTFGGSNGGNLRLRGKNKNGTSTSMWSYANISFTPSNENSDTQVACTGDIRTLLDYENYNTVETSNARFCRLFENCTQLTSAPELPATTLERYCYSNMFEGCTSLTTAPELPATTLDDCNYCYSYMFSGCTSLTKAPALPATTLANSCYWSMFDGCTALTSAPELPATTLADNCYSVMFNGCTSLTTAPELKATTLANSCYSTMFRGCTSLTTAPKLPATTLAYNCYSFMFNGCTSLTTAPELPAMTLAQSCYSNMFEGCTSLTTAPELPATTLDDNCYYKMFASCTSLITAPELPATTLADYCYYKMFDSCTNLKSVTMLATNVSASRCLDNWLNDAGTGTSSRTLKVENKDAYNTIVNTTYFDPVSAYNISVLPYKWKAGTSGATILDKDDNDITSQLTNP